MVVGVSRQETLNLGFVLFGTRQQGVPVIIRKLIPPCGSNNVIRSFITSDVIAEIFGPRRIPVGLRYLRL
ncbi:unnamed protein product [Schistosoma margrebowiei]|uniref:Uncharacterized protein n=1 Tax=Schistosoma margrebowiei TaxID=48269 RepID=A0A183L9H6_9TREM|nr:unnamed protein product [Schistosoma margrebowiei]